MVAVADEEEEIPEIPPPRTHVVEEPYVEELVPYVKELVGTER